MAFALFSHPWSGGTTILLIRCLVGAAVAEEVDPERVQAFSVDRPPGAALDAASVYLEGAGLVSPGLAGAIERDGDSLVVHHGRLRTRIEAVREGASTTVHVTRTGRAPLEASRNWLYVMGLLGTLLAWGLAVYNDRSLDPFNPLVTLAIFFAALIAAVVVLYVVDRSMERRVRHLMGSLEDAVRGDPVLVLAREVAGLERQAALVNALLFYCAAIVVEFLVFAILLSDGVRAAIDEAATLRAMRTGFLIPVVPAALFGALYLTAIRRLHRTRLELVERRAGRAGRGGRPRKA